MALGFKVADGYVEVHARYDKNELQKAAGGAANDFDDGWQRESDRDSRRRGHGIAGGLEKQVDRDKGRLRRLGAKIGTHIKNGLMSGPAFGRNFIEAITFGQADIGKLNTKGIAKVFGALGTATGAIFAAALVAEIGNAVTALLPIALGGALLAIPIADLIFRNVDLEKGKLKFKKNDVGQALKGFIRQAQQLADAMGKVFQGPFITGLRLTTQLMQGLEKPLTKAIKAITPGAMAMWKGFLGGIVAFGKAFAPALPGINAGLKTWGQEFPKIGKALGDMFAAILKDPEAVSRAIKDLSETLQFLARALGVVIPFLTAAAHWFHQFGGLPQQIMSLGRAFKSLTPILQQFGVWLMRGGVAKAFKTMVLDAVAAVGGLGDKIGAKLKAAQDKITKKAKDIVDAVVKWLKQLPGKAATAVGAIGDKIGAKIKAAQDKATKKAKDLVDGVVKWLKGLPGKAASAVAALWSKMSGKFSDAVTKAKAKAKDLVDGFIKKVKELPGKAGAEVGKVKGKVQAALSGAGKWLVSAGAEMIKGLASGISGAAHFVADAAVKAAKAAVSAAKKALGIKSPSTVFAEEVGKPSAQGIAAGIEQQFPVAMKGLAGLLPAGGSGGSSGGNTYQTGSTFSPVIHVHTHAGLNELGAANRRQLTKEIFLSLEQYRKDYVR